MLPAIQSCVCFSGADRKHKYPLPRRAEKIRMSRGTENRVADLTATPHVTPQHPCPSSSEAILKQLRRRPQESRQHRLKKFAGVQYSWSHRDRIDPLHRLAATSATPRIIDLAYLCHQLQKNGIVFVGTASPNQKLRCQQNLQHGGVLAHGLFRQEPVLSNSSSTDEIQGSWHSAAKVVTQPEGLSEELGICLSLRSRDVGTMQRTSTYVANETVRSTGAPPGIQLHTFLFPPPLRRRTDRLKAAALQFFLMGSFIYLPPLLYIVYKKYCTTRRKRVIFALFLITLYLLPVPAYLPSRGWKIWDSLHNFYRATVILEDARELPPQKPVIYAALPHGIVPVAQAMLALTGFQKFLGSIRLVIASVVKRVPVWGHCARLFGAHSADKASVRAALENGKESLLIVPGGIAEMYETCSSAERLHLRDRKGFIKLAMEAGADVIPVYCFGNSQTFRLAPGNQILKPLGRLLRTAFLLFYGRFGLPIPYEVPLLYVVGRRLKLPASSHPTECEVEASHKLFVEEIRRIFHTYKHLYGWQNKILHIL